MESLKPDERHILRELEINPGAIKVGEIYKFTFKLKRYVQQRCTVWGVQGVEDGCRLPALGVANPLTVVRPFQGWVVTI
jgi:hypothetical protein